MKLIFVVVAMFVSGKRHKIFSLSDDWNAAAASLATIFPAIPESLQTNIIRVFISSPPDMSEEREFFMQVCLQQQ